MPRLLLVVLVLDALFLGFALWGSRASGPGNAAVGAALATLAAIVTAAPLVVALVLWFAGMGHPRGTPPALAVVGYQYPGVLGERRYDRTLHGADDFADPGTRALAAAIADGNDAVVRDLAAHGADLNARGPKDGTLLTFAVFYWPERVPLLLDRGLDPGFVNIRSDSVKSILDEGYVDDTTLADPGYRALISRLAERGVRVQRTAARAGRGVWGSYAAAPSNRSSFWRTSAGSTTGFAR